jgi:hypothetical protein
MLSYFFHVFRRVFPGVKHLSIPVPVAWRRFPAGATFESVEGFEWWGWGAGKDQPKGSQQRRVEPCWGGHGWAWFVSERWLKQLSF